MNRKGIVVVFKKELTTGQIKTLCEKLAPHVDTYFTATDKYKIPLVQEFDDQYGTGPVWYIP
jgi:hypothetical protein